MSELTECNYCSKLRYEAIAKARGVELSCKLLPLSHEMGGWWAVQFSDEDEPFAYWMALSDRCVC